MTDLERRLTVLEKKARRWQLMTVGCLLIWAGSQLVGDVWAQKGEEKPESTVLKADAIECRAIYLLDADGRQVGKWRTTTLGSILELDSKSHSIDLIAHDDSAQIKVGGPDKQLMLTDARVRGITYGPKRDELLKRLFDDKSLSREDRQQLLADLQAQDFRTFELRNNSSDGVGGGGLSIGDSRGEIVGSFIAFADGSLLSLMGRGKHESGIALSASASDSTSDAARSQISLRSPRGELAATPLDIRAEYHTPEYEKVQNRYRNVGDSIEPSNVELELMRKREKLLAQETFPVFSLGQMRITRGRGGQLRLHNVHGDAVVDIQSNKSNHGAIYLMNSDAKISESLIAK